MREKQVWTEVKIWGMYLKILEHLFWQEKPLYTSPTIPGVCVCVHPLETELLKIKFLSWSSFCSKKEQASPWHRRQDDKSFPGAQLMLIFVKHGLFHKEITRDQCDSRQTPCPQPFFHISIPSVPVPTDKGMAHLQKFHPDYRKGTTRGWNTQKSIVKRHR